MVNMTRLLLSMVSASCACGCFPAQFTDRPKVIGDVINSYGSPVSGVEITLYKGKWPGRRYTGNSAKEALAQSDFASTPSISTITNDKGRFTLESAQHWNLYFPPADYFPDPWRLRVLRNGNEVASLDFSHSRIDKNTQNVGHIILSQYQATH